MESFIAYEKCTMLSILGTSDLRDISIRGQNWDRATGLMGLHAFE